MINSDPNYWIISAGDNERDYSELFLKHGIMLIGPGDYGNYYENKEDYCKMRVYRLRRFVEEIKPGDIVILKPGMYKRVIAAGIVEEGRNWIENELENGYFYTKVFSDVEGFSLQHGRYVTWHKADKPQELDWWRGTIIQARDKLLPIIKPFAEETLRNPLVKPKRIPKLPTSTTNVDLIDKLILEGFSETQAILFVHEFSRIRQLGKWYEEQIYESGVDLSEHETITFLIVPLLLALGWSEKQLKIEWEQIDLAFFEKDYADTDEPMMILEAKKKTKPLQQAAKQARHYSQKYPNCKKLIVSNGIKYKLYKKIDSAWKYKAFLDILNPFEKHPYDHNIDGAPQLLADLRS
ncbi:MAG: type I restriction enzyme HsdR N-terminal domain-containing protein [Candidatus Bathyarchaeum sp.]|nr:MAG: type I restriction enzyme HsdR N-terminal domain-containing protein [Candidatus Bathyarchaeum sp.]